MTDPSAKATSAHDVLAIEQALRAAVPEAVFASSRVVRRIIRSDLDIPLLRARVPHRDSILLSPERLLELADDLWAMPPVLPETILLIARPDRERFTAGNGTALLREYWRVLYHGCLDIATRKAVASRAATGRELVALVERIGETAVEEATAVLAREGLLRDRGNRREAVAEFMATYLELEAFSPELVPIWFPAVDDHVAITEVFADMVEPHDLLVLTRPAPLADHVPRPAQAVSLGPRARPHRKPGRLAAFAARSIRRRAAAAARRGNDVRAALLEWRLGELAGDDAAAREGATRSCSRTISRFVARLSVAIGTRSMSAAATERVVAGLLDQAAGSAWSQAARLLYDLQKACLDSERASFRTQLLSWAFTLGRVPLVRPLPSQGVALVHRHVATAFRRLPALGLSDDLPALTKILESGLGTTEQTLRERLGPPIRDAFHQAGFAPACVVEEAAFDKLVDDLLDDISARGFESFGSVRDAVSRGQVKLPDITNVAEVVRGDPLLKANRNLASALDGAYRQAPFYLLAMQRLSALAFGAMIGRAITLHGLLPFGGAWVFWKGLEHVVEPLSRYSLGTPIHIYSRTAVVLTGLGIWLLMHLPSVRAAIEEGLRALGALLHMAFVVLPRWLLQLPAVEQLLRSKPVRIFRQYAWSPLVVTVVVWLLLPHSGSWLSRNTSWLPGAVFAASALILNSPPGRVIQERLLEAIGRAIYQLHVHLVIGLITLIVDVFRRAMDAIEGMLYAVDEQLRFRTGESRLALGVKAVLTTLWSGIDWFVRFCVTLLIEPQINPIKHFPVVTVSHKFFVPMIPVAASSLTAATGMEKKLALTMMTFISTTIPGVFGFLAWELKENWRLYAANRPRLLKPVAVGHHAESMRRLLIPGFHSGTIPKLFAKLRRQRRGRGGPISIGPSRAEEELVELGHRIADVVEDECLGLLRRTRLLADVAIHIARVGLATNRVTIELTAPSIGSESLRLEFVQGGGTLSSRLVRPGWMALLADDQQRIVRRALAGLDALFGVDFTTREDDGVSESVPVEGIVWVEWRDAWEADRLSAADHAATPCR
jgi:hypothetical protein